MQDTKDLEVQRIVDSISIENKIETTILSYKPNANDKGRLIAPKINWKSKV
jgi:hypothetical protein